MNGKNLITIAEYARIRGCSTAAVYKRLDTTLKPYSKTVGKKAYLSRQVLIDEGLITVENPVEEETKNQPLNITVDNPLQPQEDSTEPATIEIMKVLERQLEAKEKEIERLHQENNNLQQQLNDAAKHNQENTERLLELLAQAQELNRNNQILLAQSNNKQPEQIEEKAEETQQPQQAPKKKNWLARLFTGE